MSNAMRSGKRVLAGVAAGALAAGSLALVGSTSAQAATYAVTWGFPSVTVIQTADDTIAMPIITTEDGVKKNLAGTHLAITITDKDGASAGGVTPQAAAKWGLSDDSLSPSALSSGVGNVWVGWGDLSDDSTYAYIATGTYTLTATLLSDTTGVALASNSTPVVLVSAANASTVAGTATFVDSAAWDADASSPVSYATDDSVQASGPWYTTFANGAGGPIVGPDAMFKGEASPSRSGTNAALSGAANYGKPGVITMSADAAADAWSSTAGTGELTATFASPANQIEGTLAVTIADSATMSAFDIDSAISAAYTKYPGMTADDSIMVPATNGVEFTVSGTMKTGSPAAATSGVAVTFTPAGYDDSNNATATAYSLISPSSATTVASDGSGIASQKFTVTNPVAGKGVRVTATYPGNSSGDVFFVYFATPVQQDLTVNVSNVTAKNSGQVSVGAVVTDNFGEPVSGLPVQIEVTGIAATSAPLPVLTTGSDGSVTYTYDVPAGTPKGTTSTVKFEAWNGSSFPTSGALYGTTTVTYTDADVDVASLTATGTFDVSGSSYTALTGGALNDSDTPLFINTQMNTSAVSVASQNYYTWGIKVVAKNAAGTVLAGAPVTLESTNGGWAVKSGAAVTSQTKYSDTSGVVEFDLTATATGVISYSLTSGTASTSVSATYANRPTDARYVSTVAADARVNAGSGTTLHVEVTDRWGNLVPGVAVSISENGPGYIPGSGTGTTGSTGSAEFTFVTVADQTGTAAITGTVDDTISASMPSAAPSSTDQVYKTISTIATQVGNDADTVTGYTVADPPVGSSATVTGVSAGSGSGKVNVDVVAGGAAKTIAINGYRTTVKGKPGVFVDGLTTGFQEFDPMVPYIKFPGQTSYSAGTSRPKVDAYGEFTWQRKTGKKIYIYFSNEDGDVRSDRIIIQAK